MQQSNQACRATCNTRVELAVSVHSMVNMDLYSQGWYAIRVRAQPCAVSSSLRVSTQDDGIKDDLAGTPSHLHSQTEQSGLRSRVFLVRYIQQQTTLHHTVSLVLDQVADQDATGVECTLDLELLYQPLVYARSVDPPSSLQLTCLSKQSYHLSGLEQGLHAIQPVVFASPNLAVCTLTVHSIALQQVAGTITYRASDDIEGELGHQIDSCMQSALSHCWGAPNIQSVTHKRNVHALATNQPQDTKGQFKQQPQLSQPAEKKQDGVKQGSAARSRPTGSAFASLADIEQEPDVKSWSSGVEGILESQPVESMEMGLDAAQYHRIRASMVASLGAEKKPQSAGAVRQSAKALSNLLVSFVTSHCYPQLQLLKAKLLKGSQAIAPSEQSSQSWSRAVEAEAEAVAADWVCLLWLLQKAPADVAQGLRAEWQQGQAQEFATWVRPASELNAVRSKAAAKLMRQQLRELSITSQSRPGSSKPSMANLTLQIGHSPLSLSSPTGPNSLGQQQMPKGSPNMPGLGPNKANPGVSLVQPSSPSRLWPGSTPPLHPASPTRAAAGLLSPVQRSGPSKGGLRWGSWGKSDATPTAQANSPLVQSSNPSRNWPGEWGSPVVQSSSPSRNWAGPQGNSLVQSSSPSRSWAGAGGNLGVQSSSPSRAWATATPPVQSSAPSFLKGWLSKQRGHSVAEEQAMEAFRLQLALQAGQSEILAGPCMLDERLHLKPHHQPILFVDDSQAPNLQLVHKPMGQPTSADQIAASHAVTAGGAAYIGGSGQESPHGYGFRNPQGKSAVSLDEAESISSSPRASPLRMMQRLISHSKGHTFGHAAKQAATAKAVDSRDTSMSEAGVKALLYERQGSSSSNSSRLHAAGPSHGSDSRFAAMKSLTRHAISLDSPTKLETCRRRGTLIPRKALAAGRSLESGLDQVPAGYDFDLGSNLSLTSSAEGSAASSFTDAQTSLVSPGLLHLHSAPVITSREASITQAMADQYLGAFGDGAPTMTNPRDSSTAALLFDPHQLAISPEQAIASNAEYVAASLLDVSKAQNGQAQPGDSVNIVNAAFLQSGSSQQHSLQDAVLPCSKSEENLQHITSDSQAGHSAETCVAAIGGSDHAPRDAQMLPLSQDSLVFSLLDPDSFVEAQISEEQQLLDPAVGDSSSAQTEDHQLLEQPAGAFLSAQVDQQLPDESADMAPLIQEDQQLLEQPAHSSSSAQEDQQLPEQPVLSSLQQADHQTCEPAAEVSSAQEDQQSLTPGCASSSAQEEQQQLLQQLPIEASHFDVIASSQSLGNVWPIEHAGDSQPMLDPPSPTSCSAHLVTPMVLEPSHRVSVLSTSGPLGAVDHIATEAAPSEVGQGVGPVASLPGERQQGVARVLSKLPSLQSMTQRLRTQSHKGMQPVAQQLRLPGTVAEAEEERRLALPVCASEAHVVVFVHGFRGSARDLGAVRSHMQLAQPDLDFLMSRCNQDCTADGLQIMGHRLAAEVAQYLQDFENGKQRRLDKLSFVGHSIGNLIIRAALTEPVLKAYLPALWLFLSLSGPHLGYLCSANKLFCSGMWLFKKFTAGRTLHELTFTDAPELEECYLHNLAAAPSLTLFKCVLLAASPQDQYVPFDSTRIQSPKAEHQGRRATAQREMARKLLYGADGLQKTRLIRVDVDFPVKQWKSVNNAVGRTAHLAFVESEAFIRFLVWSVLQPRQLI